MCSHVERPSDESFLWCATDQNSQWLLKKDAWNDFARILRDSNGATAFPSGLHCIHLLSVIGMYFNTTCRTWERMNSWSDWNNESRHWIANKIAAYRTVGLSGFDHCRNNFSFFFSSWWFPMVMGRWESCRGRGCLDLLRSQVAVGVWYGSVLFKTMAMVPWWSNVELSWR